MKKNAKNEMTVNVGGDPAEPVILDPETAEAGGGSWTVKPGEFLSIVAGNRVLFQGNGAEVVTVKMRGE